MSSVSNLTELRTLLSALPRQELKSLNKEIRDMIANAPKEKKEKKAKRPAAVGTKAWFAFVAHCRATLAERFTAGMKAPEMAVVCKAIRQEDEAAYTAFVEKFKADNTPEKSPDNSAPASDVSDSEAPSEEAPVSDAQASSATKPVKRVRLSPEAKAAKEATESAEKEAKKAEKAQAKAAKEAKQAEEKEAKALAKAEAKAAKEAAQAEEKEAKAQAKAAKSAEKEAKKVAKATKA
jgi:hypothetical protein